MKHKLHEKLKKNPVLSAKTGDVKSGMLWVFDVGVDITSLVILLVLSQTLC
jgi:hypothetical protein